jgi:hypothetical protein
LISELANDPNRLLITTTSEVNEPHAEIAHEAIFRRWSKLREWIAAEREFRLANGTRSRAPGLGKRTGPFQE